MDLHVNDQMDEVNPNNGSRSDKSLLVTLTETIRELKEGMLGPNETRRRSVNEEKEKKALGVLKELSVVHLNQLSAWRETLKGCEAALGKSPPGGDVHADTQDCRDETNSCFVRDIFCSVGEDIEGIMEKLDSMTAKLDATILQLPAEEELSTLETLVQPEDVNTNLTLDSGQELDDDPNQTVRNENEAKGQSNDFPEKSIHCQTDLQEQPEKKPERITASLEEETKTEWITVGLTGHLQDNNAVVPDICFIRAPAAATGLLRCEVADVLSCLMVTGSEELVSRVIRVKVQEGTRFHFPLIVVVPFHARYRGNYRDVAVKIVDEERRVSYVTPQTTEGVYGGQRGSFAEVKVYSLGLFAVVSCLKRENYTAPKRGLSLKLSMDPRICLNYLPGSFAAPVMAQIMIQPVEAVLLTTVKSRRDVYRSVASTSPLLYLTHPTSQPLRRPLAITLPCPPNPEKQRRSGEEIGNQDQAHLAWKVDASLTRDRSVPNKMRILGPHGKSKETSDEFLVVLASKEKQWSVLDKVAVRNQQNGLVSFDLTENVDRLLVFRLLAVLQPSVLSSLAEELEESACSHSVTVVVRRRKDEPHAVLVAALPTRDLDWELNKLKSQGYGEAAAEEGNRSEISMCEADQLLLRFSGNITSKGANGQSEFLTFHSQRNNRLLLRLTELDSFGNHSSPHYKGSLLFFRVSRHQLEWREDQVALKDTKQLGEPVCRLSLTLPKKVRSVNRPIPARVKLCEETDSLSDSLLTWLSGELSEEDLSLLVPSLRLRRSTAQMAKLRAGDAAPFSSQVFHTLAAWRRTLPAVPRHPKLSQLARCLAKSGRPDLARELLARQGGALK